MSKYGCENLVCVISGGTSGIGLACGEKFLRDGAKVYLLGRSKSRGMGAVSDLKAITGREAKYIACDVTDKNSIDDALGQIIEKRIDILVNSAGIYLEERLENMTQESYEKIFDTNVKGTLLLTQRARSLMSGGSIINIGSDAGISGNFGCPLYCASKGAVVALTKALALDLAPHIRVNCICPADVDTPLLEKQLKAADGGYTKEDMANAYPLGRIGEASEIAHVICSVASPLNSFMTGSIITVDGGLTAQ
ncbi:MAG: SDR family oxidoreductase [Phascolarctobacterium sp.]|nr:SDR family oxidoreductase [Phascolarctobacterium sp.]